jgi:hypothetical protein
MKRYKHNLSNYKLFTCNMGELIPCGLTEVLPGDTFNHRTNVLVRMSPLAAPVMHPVSVRIHHFFVPNRLIWDEWEDFITGGADGAQTPTIPTVNTSTSATIGRVLDYYGCEKVFNHPVSALPSRAYQAIFNEYYRDQDLVSTVPTNDTGIRNIAWEKDYFTSSRPWTQKGPDVILPIGNSAPVMGLGAEDQQYIDGTNVSVYEAGGIQTTYASAKQMNATGTQSRGWLEEDPNNPGYPNIYADLQNATGSNVNDIRRAFAIQRYQEARARYGSRYTEYLRYLGVRPSDARLQRPEFLGGGRTIINISEVLQTANETNQSKADYGVGDMYGHGIAALRSNSYRKFFEEHGYVVSCFSVRPKAIYANGIPRTFLRRTKEDFFQKELQHIGQQEVFESEVYGSSEGTDAYKTFSYQDRYSEYRNQPSTITGEFRDTLDYWHLARKFASLPALNQSFTDCVPSKRIFNEQTQHSLWCVAQHKLVARRLVDRSATPRVY